MPSRLYFFFFPPRISFVLRKVKLSATLAFQGVPGIVPCGTIEWMRLGGMSGDGLVQPLRSRHGQLEQITQDYIQSDF